MTVRGFAPTTGSSGISLETAYLQSHMESIADLRKIISEDDPSISKYHRVLYFVLSLIPDESRQKEIIQKMHAKREELGRDTTIDKDNLEFLMGNAVVTGIMQYLNSSLKITTEDIIGPAGEDDVINLDTLEEEAHAET
jgi:hypothetical protein